MKIVKWVGVVSVVVLVMVFGLFFSPLRGTVHGLLLRAMAPKIYRNRNESARTDLRFFTLLRNHNWTAAHALLSPDCQRDVPEPVLRQKWEAIEAKYGRYEVYQRDEKDIGLLSDYVENDYLLRGKNGLGNAWLRLVRQNNTWRIEKLDLTPDDYRTKYGKEYDIAKRPSLRRSVAFGESMGKW